MHHPAFTHINADVRDPLAASESQEVAGLERGKIFRNFLPNGGLFLRGAGQHHVERTHHILHETAAVEREIRLGATELVAGADLPAGLGDNGVAKVLRRGTPCCERLPGLEPLDHLSFGTRGDRNERAAQAQRKQMSGE